MESQSVGTQAALTAALRPSAVTLSEFHAEYHSIVNEDLVSNAIAAYERAWRLRVKPSLGGLALGKLTPLTISRARASWSGSASTKQDALALLSRLLGLAVMEGLILANPCKSLRASRGKAHDADPVSRALSDVQVARMLTLADFHPFGQRSLAGLAFTGLRLGELVGLRWEDVDTGQGLITVRRTYSPNGSGKLEIRPTKSGHIRSVPILNELLPWLEQAQEAGFDHVFTGVRGGPFDSGNLSRAVKWPQIREKIATFPDGRELRFHDLRHTFLTRLARAGNSPQNIQRVAGHASITTTELYTRSSSTEAALAVREKMNPSNREVTFRGGENAANLRILGRL
ncbi:site-specific integrase [Salinibacterium sp. NSLL150]|uniref:tyrosine-type recombinase/integrase n=1 Tax=unclassified Salinibacterium TaxID=2632331 RepID=UPI0018CD2003|nr:MULTISPECIES: site-specific integrase [unclassified Salinibacterium]MBH0099925.1 site-specific integrase [Salinibacterium sp. NSLL35]MBH0102679.1 site-specific integrase [Salinibacterium sp. NSLL150]MBH0105439.1 site-specific integrase [Salinibacterium sp. NSLL16]MBH0108199.1 site-specific integrase [Salinibacterium sp. NSLL17]